MPCCTFLRQCSTRVAASAAVALVASGCASRPVAASTSMSASGPPDCATPSSLRGPDGAAADARYLAIATAGNQRLEVDFDRLEGPDHGHLASSQADLRDAAATEHLFDRCLLAIVFPPQTEAVAQSLPTVNEARAELTANAADDSSLSRLAEFEKQLTAANVPVENAVTTIRQLLGLPPPTPS